MPFSKNNRFEANFLLHSLSERGGKCMLKEKIQSEYGFTNFQMGQIRYALECLSSEISKLVIMGIYFAFIHKLPDYVFGVAVLMLLRSRTGGLHFKHYISCFLFTFAFMFLGINVLPAIPLDKLHMLILLFVCLIANFYSSPVVSSYRPVPNGIRVKKSKLQAGTIITAYIVFLYVCPSNLYGTIGFWIIMLQSLQLVAAKLINTKRRTQNEENQPGALA